MRIAPITLVAGLIVLVEGCTGTPAVLEGFQPPAAQSAAIVDARVEQDKQSERLSGLITSCDYGIYRVGDDQISPGRLDLLKRDLASTMGDRLTNHTLTISRYDIFYNNREAQLEVLTRWFPWWPDGPRDPSRIVMMTMMGNCSKADMTGGWYQRSEAPNATSPVIVEIEASLDGKPYTVRSVYSPETDYIGATPGLAFDAMHKANAALIAQLRGLPENMGTILMAAPDYGTGPRYDQWLRGMRADAEAKNENTMATSLPTAGKRYDQGTNNGAPAP